MPLTGFALSDRNRVKEWFEKGDWLEGWDVSPSDAISSEEFFYAYFRNSGLWSRAFQYLGNTDLKNVTPGVYSLYGSDLIVKVQDYLTKDESETMYEAHRKYADIQYMISGFEKIGISPLQSTSAVTSYNDVDDIVFLTSDQDDYHLASPKNFFIFLPQDAHRPCVRTGHVTRVRKIVIKVGIC